jgi:sortase (surface protein transpeptidase)
LGERRDRDRSHRWARVAGFALLSLVLLALSLAPTLDREPSAVGEIPTSTSLRASVDGLTAVPGWSTLEDLPGAGSRQVNSSTSTSAPGKDAVEAAPIPPDFPEAPQRVVIPSIGVDAELIPVGLKPDGTMEVPDFGLAAWYDLGPKPGAAGPAVIVAHVDSKRGPDVFYRLRELTPGDQVEVTYPEGRTVAFTVEGKEQISKSELPVDRIWLQTQAPILRLITCGGEFDRSTGHYRSNVIVYASLAEAG